MTGLATVREKLLQIAGLGVERFDEVSTPILLVDPAFRQSEIAKEALALLDEYVAGRRKSFPFLLACVDESCITKCEPFGSGAMEMRARFGVVEVSDFYSGDEATMSDETIVSNAKAAVLDSLRVEIVRRRVLEASDHDLLDALDAAERGGDEEVGEIRVAAHDRGLRRIG